MKERDRRAVFFSLTNVGDRTTFSRSVRVTSIESLSRGSLWAMRTEQSSVSCSVFFVKSENETPKDLRSLIEDSIARTRCTQNEEFLVVSSYEQYYSDQWQC